MTAPAEAASVKAPVVAQADAAKGGPTSAAASRPVRQAVAQAQPKATKVGKASAKTGDATTTAAVTAAGRRAPTRKG